MLARANELKAKHNKANVSFVEAQITDMSAISSNTADCIISNCVVNLVPEAEKHLVFKEVYRVLKPGGRVAISDILAKKPLPEKLRANMALYVGCVSGASLVEQYQQYLKEAGFPAESVVIKDDGADLNVYMETNADGTRTAGGMGGNLCCNPKIESAPSEPKAAATSCCSSSKAEAAPSAASSCCPAPEKKATSCGSATKAEADASSSCCGGGDKQAPSQTYAFDEKDLADLEGEDLNKWAGKRKHLSSSPICDRRANPVLCGRLIQDIRGEALNQHHARLKRLKT